VGRLDAASKRRIGTLPGFEYTFAKLFAVARKAVTAGPATSGPGSQRSGGVAWAHRPAPRSPSRKSDYLVGGVSREVDTDGTADSADR
jgi:hypothetical protein